MKIGVLTCFAGGLDEIGKEGSLKKSSIFSFARGVF